MIIPPCSVGVPVTVTVSPALALVGLYESVPPVTELPSDTVYVEGDSVLYVAVRFLILATTSWSAGAVLRPMFI